MTDYLTKVKDPSRTLVQLVEIDLDTCLLTYSIAPCTASGGQCSNTFKTCEDKENFDIGVKTFLFQSKLSPLVLKGLQAKPSLVSISPVATEIEPRESITINPRMEFVFDDEPDPQPINHDKGAGFFHPLRKSTFWKILTSIHPNFRRKPIRLFEGFPDSLKSEYRLKFSGIIENIEFIADGKVRVTATDEMKKFRELKIPNAVSSSNVTTADIDDVTTTLPITDGTQFKLLSGGFDAFVKIIDATNGDEYAKMTGISDNDLTIERSGLFGTSVNSHAQGLGVIQVAPFLNDNDTGIDTDLGQNPVDIMLEILMGWVGLDASKVDVTAFESERDSFASLSAFRRIVEEPIQVETLLAQIRLLSFGSIWTNEAGKLTFRFLRPNSPHEFDFSFTDDANIVLNSGLVDLNADAQKSTVILYSKPVDIFGFTDHDKRSEFQDIDVSSDLNAIDPNNFDEDNIFGPVFADWIFREAEKKQFLSKYLRRFAEAPPMYEFSIDRKDSEIQTGDLVDITSKDFVDQEGNQLLTNFQVLRKREQLGGLVQLRCLGTKFVRRYGFISHPGQPDYPGASDLDRRHAYIGENVKNEVGTLGDDGYYIF